jgi:Mg2+ and Co2+ transporter CorA
MKVTRVLRKFVRVRKDQQELIEKLIDDILNGQFRLLSDRERAIEQFERNRFDEDLPW